MPTVIWIFEESIDAERAASAMYAAGLGDREVSLIQRDQDLRRSVGTPPSVFTGIQAQNVRGLDSGASAAPTGAGVGMGEAAGGAYTSAESLRKLLIKHGLGEASAEHLAGRVERGGSLLIVHARAEQLEQIQRTMSAAGAGSVDVTGA